MEGFRIDRQDEDGRSVVSVWGEVDLASAPELKSCLFDVVADGITEVVLDLSATDFLDSTGLSAVVSGYKRLRAHNGHMTVVVTSPRVRRVFEITNLDRVLPIAGSAEG